MKGFESFRSSAGTIQLGLGLLLLASGCAQSGTVASTMTAPAPVLPPLPVQSIPAGDMVLVECRLLDGGTTISAPRIVMLSGREAVVSTEYPVTLPDDKQKPAGFSLRIVPRMEGSSVIFQGQCAMRQLAPSSTSQGLQTTTWTERETWFSGTTSLDEEVAFRMTAGVPTKGSQNDPGILVQLRFSRVPGATSQVRP